MKKFFNAKNIIVVTLAVAGTVGGIFAGKGIYKKRQANKLLETSEK